jgi:signal transduction histidine kinase
VEVAGAYQFFNSDSALILTHKAMELARELHFTRGEVKATSRHGEVLHIRGELPQALEAELMAIQLSRKYNYQEAEAESLVFIATIYLDLADYRQALTYLFQAKNIYDKIAGQLSSGVAQQFPPYALSNIGKAYEKLNIIDSALYFQRLALKYPINITSELQADILVGIGDIEKRQKNFSNALTTFRQVLNITGISKDLLNGSVAHYEIAEIYNQQNNIDSAIYHARLAFIKGEQSSAKTSSLNAASLLAQLYRTKDKLDSAFYYQQTAMNTKDSLFGLDKFHKLQLLTLSEQQRLHGIAEEQERSKARIQRTVFLWLIGVVLLIVFVLWRSNKLQKKANHQLNDKNLQIEKQSESLKKTLEELKATQAQLIQSEKMASLGELTAGIAHEIQNPLNFVNNFSEVNTELIGEMKHELKAGNTEEAIFIANDIEANEEKINHHGKRADAIVKGMLQHSRSSSGMKEPTDINALCDEYLRLSYHGLRAKDKSFNAILETHFDPAVGKVNVAGQDIGRVLLNLFNNSFYAVNERKKQNPDPRLGNYEPTVYVSTEREGDHILIKVKDNGNGIPEKVLEKIYQPFFTTKPTGEGTGLGLSLSYDIVTKGHGGEMKVETQEGEGSEFIIQIPIR